VTCHRCIGPALVLNESRRTNEILSMSDRCSPMINPFESNLNPHPDRRHRTHTERHPMSLFLGGVQAIYKIPVWPQPGCMLSASDSRSRHPWLLSIE
ncbi:unnamed protein product, partial [Mycena citricolor]